MESERVVQDKMRIGSPFFSGTLLLIMWGSFAAVSKLTLAKVDGYQMLFYMFGSAFLIMTAIMAFTRRIQELFSIPRREFIFTILTALPSFMYYFFYVLSIERIPVLEASMLNYLFPVMVVIFAVIINGEQWNTAKLISLVLGFAGMLVILTDGRLDHLRLTNIKGDLLAISAAASWGIFSNLGKKNKVSGDLSNYIYTSVSFVLSFIILLVYSKIVLPVGDTFAGLIWISLSNIVVAYPLWFNILKTSSTLLAAGISFLTPFITLVFIMILLHQPITMMQVVGLLIIAASMVIPGITKRVY